MKNVYHIQIGIVSLIAIALLGAASTAAQTNVETRLELTTEDEQETREWDGEDLDIVWQARLCWEAAGGINPNDEEFNLTIEVDAPEGANATVDPENTSVAPPSGPTDGSGCTDPVEVTLTLRADQGLQSNQTLNVTVTVTEANGEAVGTFDPPEENSTSTEVRTTEDFDPEGPEDDGDDPADTPAPGAIVLLAVLALLIAYRRKGPAARR